MAKTRKIDVYLIVRDTREKIVGREYLYSTNRFARCCDAVAQAHTFEQYKGREIEARFDKRSR